MAYKPTGRPRGRPRKNPRPEDTPDPTPPDVPKQVPAEGKLPLWKRRANALRKSGTTPRDLYGGEDNPFEIKGPKRTMDNVHFMWMSDPIWNKQLPMPGFNRAMYEPVNEDLMKEFGITVRTKDRTTEGVPKVGQDAWLMWCPKELWKEQEALQRGKPLKEILEQEQKESEGKMAHDKEYTSPIGGVKTSEDLRDITEKERDYVDVGSPFN